MTPGTANAIHAVGPRALKRRNRANGPDADEASLRIALDLHGQQQNLQKDYAREQDQRSMSRGKGYHVNPEIRNSKTENRNAKLGCIAAQNSLGGIL
jgi:chemotaxis methyl-accepting protein methylase